MKRLILLPVLLSLAAVPALAGEGAGCATSAKVTGAPTGAASTDAASTDAALIDPATTASTVSADRAAIDVLIAAMAAGDAAAVNAAFTPDAGYAYSLDGDLNRGDAFDAWIASDITGPGSTFVIESATETAGTIDALVLWGRGEASSPARYVFTVVDGRIDSWRMTGR